MNVRFACPVCDCPGRQELPASESWQCPACDHLLPVHEAAKDSGLHACVICGTTELYKKKDFPHWLGMAILAVACLGSIIPYYYYHQWLTWTILIGSAVIDGVLYLLVGDVVVCYRCNSQYRKLVPSADHKPFDLGIGERYRQERIRREQLQTAKKSRGS